MILRKRDFAAISEFRRTRRKDEPQQDAGRDNDKHDHDCEETESEAAHACFLPASTPRSIGRWRSGIPVAAYTALQIAGGAVVAPVSPIPPGGSPLLMRCTSIPGASSMRSMR